MKEASKTLALLQAQELALLGDDGIDIGCGDDPVRPDYIAFDRAQGDASCPARSLPAHARFSTVFSSHCLEHLPDAPAALAAWWDLVRPGGTMFVIVPDAELYEQGYWPSIFNAEHRWRFSMGSGPGTDLPSLITALDRADIVIMRRQDAGYQHRAHHHRMWPRTLARASNRLRSRLLRSRPNLRTIIDSCYAALRLPIDQTVTGAAAQILVVARKQIA